MKDARLHFMGIGGQGISAVAQMALQEGARISGCDQSASATTRMLMQKGVPVEIGHSPKHLANADVLIHVPAVVAFDPDNPELVAAKASGMLVMTWQELMGKWMQGKLVLSVSGVHGKGTTTAMLALMLVEAGLDPTCEIGAIVPGFGVNYRIGKSRYFVNEADEFNNNFWNYHPRLVIVTSIEFEHPEFFADYAAFLESFEHFIRGMDMYSDWPFPPTLILNADSPGCLELQGRLNDWTGRILMYAVDGLSHSEVTKVGSIPSNAHILSDYTAYDVKLEGETSFRVRSQEREGKAFPTDKIIHLLLPGVYNIQNALAALAAAHSTGVNDDVIIRTLENFSGIERRFEIRYQGLLQLNGVTQDVILIDDYAHHPTAITATLEAARKRFPGRRLIAVYQPHMYSRTKTFFEQFLTAFDSADVVMIADIFQGREHDTGSIHARELVEAMVKRPLFSSSEQRVMYSGNVENTAVLLRNTLRSGDVALVMGAGDINTVTEKLLQRIWETIMTLDAETIYKKLQPHFQERVRLNEPMARHCTFGVGGLADVWVSPDTSRELTDLVRMSIEEQWPLLVVGNGTNILFADAGVRGIVARIVLDNYTIEDQGDNTALLMAEAGVSFPRLLNELAAKGWGGLEFGPGIPGTLGGGVISNAGAHNSDLGEVLEWIEVLDARGASIPQDGVSVPIIRRYLHDEIDLSYRHSRFRNERRIGFNAQGYPIVPPRGLIEPNEIILQLGIRLRHEDPEKLRTIIEEYKQHRKTTQPPQKSAGSVFKNPPGDYAGRLIDQAGLKGTTHGKAQISKRHANFIINLGGACAADIVALIVEARNRVHEQFGVDLELEVELRGEWGK